MTTEQRSEAHLFGSRFAYFCVNAGCMRSREIGELCEVCEEESMKTKTEIEKEIQALEACKSYAPRLTLFGENNHRKIDLQIEYLRGEIDITADDEWNEFSDNEQDAILEAQAWQEGQSDETPSSGWDMYKKKKA